MNDRNQDPVEKLIQATGPRPVVPDETTRRVKAAVHQHWRETVGESGPRHRFRTTLTLAAAAVFLLTGGLITWDRLEHTGGGQDGAVILAVSGSTTLNVGDRLEFGAGLVTPADGGMAIGTAPGQSVRLDAGTTLRLIAQDTLELGRGAVYVDSHGSGESDPPPITIHTDLGTFREIGTQFEVRLEEENVRVRVREGRVAVEHGQDDLQLVAGREMEINYRGEIRNGEIDPASSEWGWIGELTPMPAIEGRPVRQFLEWIVREKGLKLQFQDAALYSASAEISLNGSIEGMTLDQALEAVLPTCGMTYRIQDGTLTVLRAE